MKDKHEFIMACTHILKGNQTAENDQFPDLLCEDCSERMANNDLPLEVNLVCKNCVLSHVAKEFPEIG